MPTMRVLRCPGSVHQLGGVDVNLHVVCARLPIQDVPAQHGALARSRIPRLGIDRIRWWARHDDEHSPTCWIWRRAATLAAICSLLWG
jgi:hypothetical protein